MESDQRTTREMTYKAGWKRGKIVAAPTKADAPPSAAEQTEPARSAAESVHPVHRINRDVFWKGTPIPSFKALQAVFFALPAVVFALFVWMVYWLSRFS